MTVPQAALVMVETLRWCTQSGALQSMWKSVLDAQSVIWTHAFTPWKEVEVGTSSAYVPSRGGVCRPLR